jgi:hypothetical protein
MRRLYILTLISVTLATAIFLSKRKTHTTVAAGEGLVIPKEWLVVNKALKTPAEDVRPADQTFLTFPEWYLVFSPEEQADYYAHTTSTTFPFMTHTAQIWESYKIMNDQIKDNFPPNDGYHLMIRVIGVSASAEYTVKAWYELVAGRITDTTIPVTEEDVFNARFTREYVDFINDLPWYQFDFKKRLGELWSATPFFGDHMLRKMERRYILTSELMIKYAYGKLIGLGTQQVYDEALLTTAVILDNDSLVHLPRYNRFAGAAAALARQGHSFKEIAGNNSAIVVTIITNTDSNDTFEGTQKVFTQLISSDPRWKRVALVVPGPGLHTLLLQLERQEVQVEHVFDY